MTGFNDILENEDFGKKVKLVMIAKTNDMKHIFDELAFVSPEDVAQKMVQAFVDEYSMYADMEQKLREHADELERWTWISRMLSSMTLWTYWSSRYRSPLIRHPARFSHPL